MEMAPQVPSTQPGGWSLQSHDGSSSSCLEGMGGQTFWADSEGVPPYVPPLPAQLTHTALGLKFSILFIYTLYKKRPENQEAGIMWTILESPTTKPVCIFVMEELLKDYKWLLLQS